MAAGRPARPGVRRRGERWLLTVLVAFLSVAVATPAVATPPQPDGADAWFGPVIDTGRDSLGDYAARLGADPSLVSVELGYPLDDDARGASDPGVGLEHKFHV